MFIVWELQFGGRLTDFAGISAQRYMVIVIVIAIAAIIPSPSPSSSLLSWLIQISMANFIFAATFATLTLSPKSI